MKTRYQFIVVLTASLLLSACGPLEIGLEETATPAGPQPTIAPTATPPATSVPTATPAATQTYRNDAVGFELDYPAEWVVDTAGISNGVILWSKQPEGPGNDGAPADVVKIDVMALPDVTLRLDELAAQQKAEVANVNGSILAEERITLASGLEVVRLHVSSLGEAVSLLAVINGHPVYVTGFGDLSRFDDVARTLRPVESSPTGPVGFACSVAYGDGARLYCLGEGGTPIPIAEAGGQGTLSRPLISADGALVAYLLDKTDGNSELWAVDVSTLTGNDGLTLPRRLLAGASQISSGQPEVVDSPLSYQWQGNTHTLYFNTRYWPVGGPTGPGEYTHNDLWKVNADTGEVLNVLSRNSVGQFYLSPDGQYVGLSNPQSIAVLRADGTDFKLVLEFPAIITYSEYTYKPALVWSPDSASFSALIPSADPLAADASGAVYRALVTGEVQTLAALSGNFLFGVPLGAGLSPDGQRLAYIQTQRDNIVHLRVMNSDGAGDGPLADDPNLNPLGWSPDSNYFAYTAGSNGNYAATLTGGSQLFGQGLQATSLEWVDGASFYFLGVNGAGEWGLYFQRLGEPTQSVATGLNFSASLDVR
jgi:hypothetical protein